MDVAQHEQARLAVRLDRFQHGIGLEQRLGGRQLAEAEPLQAVGHGPHEQGQRFLDREPCQQLARAVLVVRLDHQQGHVRADQQLQVPAVAHRLGLRLLHHPVATRSACIRAAICSGVRLSICVPTIQTCPKGSRNAPLRSP